MTDAPDWRPMIFMIRSDRCWLERHEIRFDHHRALALLFEHDLSENRYALFRIML
jgi:hypothetical protein